MFSRKREDEISTSERPCCSQEQKNNFRNSVNKLMFIMSDGVVR